MKSTSPLSSSLLIPLFLLLIVSSLTSAQIALTPPLGWNTYDTWPLGINETNFLANVHVLQSQLLQYGWEYAVVDAGWYSNPAGNTTNDGSSRLIPNPERWPSAAGGVGFKAISDQLHSAGLKFGIHVMRGIYSQVVAENQPIAGTQYHAQDIAVKGDACVWWPEWYGVNLTHPAGQAYYDSLFSLYASWGVDYVKVDCIFGSRDGHTADIEAVSAAVAKASDKMLLSLSPGLGATPALAEEINSKVNMYRITDDLWDCWNNESTNPPCPYDNVTVVKAFNTFAEFQSLVGAPGLSGGRSWPDGDALPIGVVSSPTNSSMRMPSGLTQAQQRTVVSLWSIFRAPLIFGGDLTMLDQFTHDLLTNSEILAINQYSTGNEQLYASSDDSFYVWRAVSTIDKSTYVAFFNTAKNNINYSFSFSQVGLKGTCGVRDLWKREYLGAFSESLIVWIDSGDSVVYQISCN